MPAELLLLRHHDDGTQTVGALLVVKGAALAGAFDVLELAWRDNRRQISCIPPGRYRVVHRTSPKFGRHLHITGVPGRDLILIHAGNYHRHTKGCPLVGDGVRQLDGGGRLDLTNSRDALARLLALVPRGEQVWVTVQAAPVIGSATPAARFFGGTEPPVSELAADDDDRLPRSSGEPEPEPEPDALEPEPEPEPDPPARLAPRPPARLPAPRMSHPPTDTTSAVVDVKPAIESRTTWLGFAFALANAALLAVVGVDLGDGLAAEEVIVLSNVLGGLGLPLLRRRSDAVVRGFLRVPG